MQIKSTLIGNLKIKDTISDYNTVKTCINKIVVPCKNMIDPELTIANGNGNFNTTTGDITFDGNNYIYGKFDLIVGQPYNIQKTTKAVYVQFFDSNGNYVKGKQIIIGGNITSKSFVAEYPSCLLYLTASHSAVKLQFEVGDVATPYIEYRDELNENIYIKKLGNSTLRTENTTITDAINEVDDKTNINSYMLSRTYNLFNPSKFEIGNLQQNGTIKYNDSFATTDYIECNENDIVRMSTIFYSLVFFDQNKSAIEYSEARRNYAIVPQNAKYIRITFTSIPKLESLFKISVYISDDEKPYVPYYVMNSAFTTDGNNKRENLPEFITSKKLFVAEGKEVDINLQSVLMKCNVNSLYANGIQNAIYPTIDYKTIITGGTAPDQNITLYIQPTYYESQSTKINVKTVPSNSGSGLSKKVLFIGDSKIGQNKITQFLLDMFDDDTMDITLLGTRGNSETNRHEGYGGWSAKTFVTNIWERGDRFDSPFFNKSTNKFDFGYYMANNNYDYVDYVFICLGANDNLSNMIQYYTEMITNIKQYDNNIIIGLCTPAPAATFGGYKPIGNDTNMFKKIKLLLQEFDSTTYENQKVYIVPTHMNIDTFYDFNWIEVPYNNGSSEKYRKCTDSIHEVNGYEHVSAVIFGYIKHFALL